MKAAFLVLKIVVLQLRYMLFISSINRKGKIQWNNKYVVDLN